MSATVIDSESCEKRTMKQGLKAPNPKAVDGEPDDLEVETGVKGGLSLQHGNKSAPLSITLRLAFQSIGVIYGDVGTSPLYVFSSTFAHTPESSGIQPTEKHVIGALSLIIWTITLIALVKYVIIVLSADDNGEGGTFALYSLLCRHVRMSHRKNEQQADYRLSTYSISGSRRQLRGVAAKLKEVLEDYRWLQIGFLLVVMAAASMAMGDGVFTPSISVLSAVSGLRVKAHGLSQNWVVAIACIIIVLLFLLQSRGTHVVGFLFAPVVLVWYFTIAIVGLYNTLKHNSKVFKAFSPHYGLLYLFDNGRQGWVSLGGILLCITGVEAMFADLGHFTQGSIQISFLGVVYPSLLLQYFGQAAYLTQHPENVAFTFYKSVPYPFFWPMLVIATGAAIVASQAMITGTFSIIRQAMFLDCFPPVKVVHTSDYVVGQVYIPEANWTLMLLTLAVTIGFRKTETLGNAYGFAVISVLITTTIMMTIIMLVVWRVNIIVALAFFVFYFCIEAVFLSAVIFKVPQGAWVPLTLAIIIMAVMYVWFYGTGKKIEYDRQNRVSMNWILSMGPDVNMKRVPGIGLFYTELASGVPPIFSHFIANLPALHQVLVFVCIKHLPVPKVPEEERFLVRRVGPREYRMYRCVVRLGYIQDAQTSDGNHEFEEKLFAAISNWVATEGSRGSRFSMDTPEDSWPAGKPFAREMVSPQGKQNGALGRALGRLTQRTNSTKELLTTHDSVGDVEGRGSNSEEGGTNGESQGIPSLMSVDSSTEAGSSDVHELGTSSGRQPAGVRTMHVTVESPKDRSEGPESEKADDDGVADEQTTEELRVLYAAKEVGMVYIVSQAWVKARKSSWWGKKVVVNGLYTFLRRNFRDTVSMLGLPHNSLMEVGMVYVI